MDLIVISAAANQLRVGERRVRQLIASGDLSAERFGRQWLVDRRDVLNLSASTRIAGHPFSSANAWGILALVEGKRPVWLSKSETKRLEMILSERGFKAVMPLLRNRAKRQAWYVHPSLLDRLSDDSRTVRAGVSAVAAFVVDESIECYVHAELASDLAHEYFADTDASVMNVLVRSIDGPWPFLPGEDTVGPIVAAVDLLDSAADERHRRVAAELLANV